MRKEWRYVALPKYQSSNKPCIHAVGSSSKHQRMRRRLRIRHATARYKWQQQKVAQMQIVIGRAMPDAIEGSSGLTSVA